MADNAELVAAFKEIAEALKHDITGSVGNQQWAHGPGAIGLPSTGIWYNPTARDDIFSSFARPVTISSALLLNAPDGGVNQEFRSEFDIFTGVTQSSGDNPADWCGTPPRSGLAKLCTHTAIYGKSFFGTQPLEVPRVGLRVNTGDRERVFRNVVAQAPFVPDILATARNLNDQTALMWYLLGIMIERQTEQVTFQGNRANPANGAGSFRGFMSQFDGIDREIRTGRFDSVTGVLCPSTDSIVYNFSNANIDGGTGTVGAANGKNIVEILTELIYRLRYRSEQEGLAPTEFVIVMHPDHFYQLTRVYPCQYFTTGCTVVNASGERLNIDATEQRRMQDDLFSTRTIMVNGGERIRVLLSTGMAETAANGGVSRSIYVLPMTVMGGIPVSYLENFNMANADMGQLMQTVSAGKFRLTNGGRYMMTYNETSFCLEYMVASMMRFILRTPQLAGRIDNVLMTMSFNTDPGIPGMTGNINGGRYPFGVPAQTVSSGS